LNFRKLASDVRTDDHIEIKIATQFQSFSHPFTTTEVITCCHLSFRSIDCTIALKPLHKSRGSKENENYDVC